MKYNEVSHKSWHGAENLFEALRRQSPDIFIIGNICKGLTNTIEYQSCKSTRQVKRQWPRGSESIRSFSVIQTYSDHSAVLDLLTHTVAICSTDMTLAGNQFVASKAAKSSASAPNLAMAVAWASWAAKTVVNLPSVQFLSDVPPLWNRCPRPPWGNFATGASSPNKRTSRKNAKPFKPFEGVLISEQQAKSC